MVNPEDSIKEQILDRVADEILLPLIDEQLVSVIKREVDPLANAEGGFVFDGDEEELRAEKDTQGRVYQFPLVLRFATVKSGQGFKEWRKKVTPRVQELIEADIQFGGLCINVDGGQERPFASVQADLRGVDIWYMVVYRRKRGDPWSTY